MPEHIPITVVDPLFGGDPVTYNNVREAWRSLSPVGLPEITVRKRLDAGWTPEDALLTPPIEPSMRRAGH